MDASAALTTHRPSHIIEAKVHAPVVFYRHIPRAPKTVSRPPLRSIGRRVGSWDILVKEEIDGPALPTS